MFNIKNVSLSLLCIVMTFQAVLMHASRTDRAPGVPLYKPAAAVILTECGKLLISALLAWRECRTALKDEGRSKALSVGSGEPSPEEKQGLLDGKDSEEEEGLFRHSQESTRSIPESPNPKAVLQRLKEDVFGPDWTKLSIPAMLFTGQSNLAYYASSNLSVPVFQITYQLKVRL
jgi:UDP-sugar transporter A1/2/3